MNVRTLGISFSLAAAMGLISDRPGGEERWDGRTALAAEQQNEKPKPPPLVVDKQAPLLLDAPKADQQQSPKLKSDSASANRACLVCHENYKEEPLASSHAEQHIGCVDCHGQSFAHRNDENNTTPPDLMYPASLIDAFCRNCHGSHDVAAREVIARLYERSLQKTDPAKISCTDCHGKHRLAIRSVRWDKNTGKLISNDKNKH